MSNSTIQRRIIHASLFTPIGHNRRTKRMRWGLTILFWGKPGVGKSDLVESVCDESGLWCLVLSPGLHGEGAFGCVPVPITLDDGTVVLTYPPPEWTKDPNYDPEIGGCVFVDEMGTAANAVQPPLLGLLQNRKVGFTYLGDNMRTMGAANPPECGAGGYDLAAPLANRQGHKEWDDYNVDEHTAYVMSDDIDHGTPQRIDPRKEMERVLKAWDSPWARARGLWTAFLKRRPELKHKMPAEGDPAMSRAWPSDRIWVSAGRALASAEVHNLSDTGKEIFVASFLGEKTANEFFTFITEADLPDPEEVLDGKVNFQHNPKRLDRTCAVLQSCTALVVSKSAAKRKARSAKLWELITEIGDSKAALDLLVPSATALVRANLHSMVTGAKLLARLNPVLVAAGVRPDSK
jgi:hypothetical protein